MRTSRWVVVTQFEVVGSHYHQMFKCTHCVVRSIPWDTGSLTTYLLCKVHTIRKAIHCVLDRV